MPTAITNLGLLNRCKRYILNDPTREDMDFLIQDALITADREIKALGRAVPLEWNKHVYDELFTRFHAEISDITQADPGVITADSLDPDLSSDHGFQDNDLVYIGGINGMERLNDRIYRVTRASATTITLQRLDNQDNIDTSGYEEYESGGVIYHAGLVLPASTIEPSGGTEDYEWTIGRVYDVTFDQYPTDPIDEETARKYKIEEPGGRPRKWRYQQQSYSSFSSSNIEHLLWWYKFPSQRYNVAVHIEKAYPDLATFDGDTYPPHPPEIHDFIWHRALGNLATHAEKARRRSAGRESGPPGDNTKIEIVHAEYWLSKMAADEAEILAYNARVAGQQAHSNSRMRG